MLLITLISIFLAGASAKDAENTCVSLATSKTCSAFSQFYVGLPGLAYDYPFLINTTTIEEFDERLLEYVNSTSDYLFPLGCLSSNYNPTIPYARYSLTRLCVGMIQDPSYSLPCNFDNGLIPPPLCQSTCYEWVDSITRITQNPRVCSDSIQRNASLASFTDQCNTWEGYNGTIAENCISGIANEPYSCGFGNNTSVACAYCQTHTNDECCQQVTYCSSSLSAGAIVGIVIGSLVGAALIVFGAIWYYCRKRHHKHVNPFTHFLPSTSTSATLTAQQQQQQQQQQQPPPPPPPLSQHQQRFTTTAASTLTGTLNGGVMVNTSTLNKIDSPFMNDKMEITNEYTFTNIPAPLRPSLENNNTHLNEEFFVVVHAYPPQLPDELELNAGDIVCLALYFDDGWALGYNVTTGKKGAFPLVCISPAPQESLDQLLQMDSSLPTTMMDASQTNTTNLQMTMEKIRENVRRSLSLNSYNNYSIHSSNSCNNDMHHSNTIPKRSASYKSYDYFEIDSPSSPTLHTPFFDANATPPLTTRPEQTNNTLNASSQRQPAP
ncbi:Septin spn4 [Mucor velutinosus]|uniref:Septin spn4 n=1 Tax=Mucor velutinosus TaxID=708070 RepID=A0AAN7HJR1_9FUNG|nr:Septin spn4 [Mucor velutinosus]